MRSLIHFLLPLRSPPEAKMRVISLLALCACSASAFMVAPVARTR